MDLFLEPEHPKKRRRRHYDQRPLLASFVLDDSLRGNVGVVSEDIWNELVAFQDEDCGMIPVRMHRKKSSNIRHRGEPGASS
jgi:hypothetical protein